MKSSDSIRNCTLTSERSLSYVLRPVRTSGVRPPLICIFPGAPGARDMAEMLSEHQPIYEFYWPNLDGAATFPTVEEIALAYIDSLRKVQAHGPYQLCGYSKGGHVAYEMARLLVSQGEDVSFLALFDTWHPRFRQSWTTKEFLRFGMFYLVDRIDKYRKFLVRGGFAEVLTGARLFVSRRGEKVVWRATRFIFRKTSRPVPLAMQLAETSVSLQAYDPKPYPKRFMLIRTEDMLEKKLSDKTVGWYVCAIAGVDVRFVSADHGRMMLKPYVRGLVDEIAPHLAGAPIS